MEISGTSTLHFRRSTRPKYKKKSQRSAKRKSLENSLGNSFFDTSNIKPKIDNKTPAFSVDLYYKSRDLEADAQTIMKIDAENYELIKRINAIHRTGGLTDCWNREFKQPSTLPENKIDLDAIAKENKNLIKRINGIKGLYSTAELMKEWRKSRASKESAKRSSSLKKNSPRKKIDGRTRCFFEIEIENNRRKLGKLTFLLFDDVVPKTCENFRAFCQGSQGLSYVGTPFHRILPGYWCQGGDVEKFNGSGEISIYGKNFDDENFQLKHSRPGILSTSGFEKNSNTSKFNLTFERLETVDGKRVVFGKLISGFSTLRALESYGSNNGRPSMKIVVSKCGVL